MHGKAATNSTQRPTATLIRFHKKHRAVRDQPPDQTELRDKQTHPQEQTKIASPKSRRHTRR